MNVKTLTHQLRLWVPFFCVAVIATVGLSALSLTPANAATVSHVVNTQNPTCLTVTDQFGNQLKECIQAWSNALTASFTGFPVNGGSQLVDVYGPSGDYRPMIFNCEGPNFSFTQSFPPGGYGGIGYIYTGTGQSGQAQFRFQLSVGDGTTGPAPPSSCTPPPPKPSFMGKVNKPVADMARTPDGGGYWMVGADGSVQAFGDAVFFGDHSHSPLNAPIVGMASTADGQGYWLLGQDGGIFSFGDAQFYGSTGSLRLNKPVVGITATPDGGGYWFVASDGGIFSFGDAQFYGSGA